MLSPDDIIGQRVWLEIPKDPDFPNLDPYRIKAVLTQPTAPPWFYARYENPPEILRAAGQWLTLKEAQDAVLLHGVAEDYLYEEDWKDWADEEDELNLK